MLQALAPARDNAEDGGNDEGAGEDDGAEDLEAGELPFVCGLRQVLRALASDRKPILMIIAHNIECVSGDGGLDHLVKRIMELGGDRVIFALTRKKIGRHIKVGIQCSAVGLMDIQTVLNEVHTLACQAKEDQKRWYNLVEEAKSKKIASSSKRKLCTAARSWSTL